ncbi:hypothetical protein [Saccharopolyspora shandongensis]|uniref:hypothetical protein n=1 Tax=Saccharopolyspora shandongensis TaxID=418495 RepID=UPI001C42EE5F|nr:hypothetical protein [Saccharopolyspora shandongensis]
MDEAAEDAKEYWPGEPWLRAALDADRGDRVAANLLAARLVQQIDFMQQTDSALDEDDDIDEAVAARGDEAAELYGRVLAADPDDPGARTGLAVLREVIEAATADPKADAYSYYLVQLDSVSGSSGFYEELVVTDADELRWACDHWFRRVDSQRGFTLVPVVSGERGSLISLDAVCVDDATDWGAVAIPPLSGELLPVGCPASSDGLRYHYGYTLNICL